MPVCARPAPEGTTAPPWGLLHLSASVTLDSIVNSTRTSQLLCKVNQIKASQMLHYSTQRIPHHMRQMEKKHPKITNFIQYKNIY